MPRSDTAAAHVRSRRAGYVFAILAITIFSLQDGISKHLGSAYPPVFVTMMRYWAFAAFVLVFASQLKGGIRGTAESAAPWLQVTRGALLAIQIVMAITCFAVIGLARTQAIFAAVPLIVTALSVLLLGERANGLRWFAVVFGLGGVIVILRPTGDFFDVKVLLAVATALMFATYALLTRVAGRVDRPMTTFFYTGIAGCATISLIGPFYWTNMTPTDWVWMAVLCTTSITSHYFLIKAYNLLDASAVQPLTYLGVVYASLLGIFVFGEEVAATTFVGAAIVVAAGLLSIWSERRSASAESRSA